jgi:hypothetical protein
LQPLSDGGVFLGKLLGKRHDLLECSSLVLPVLVLDDEPEPRLIEIKSPELVWVEQEFRLAVDESLVLNVPPPRSLLISEPRQPLVEHLPPAVLLATDRVVAE